MRKLAAITVTEDLEIEIEPDDSGASVKVRLTRIAMQNFAHAMLAYCGAEQRHFSLDRSCTLGAEDVTHRVSKTAPQERVVKVRDVVRGEALNEQDRVDRSCQRATG